MLALYRKYRPRTLSEVIGQPQVTVPLSSALKSGKFSHSYLLTGPRGCGKTSVARILAHEINGFKYEIEDSYLDIIEIDAASNTGVDNIRDLREKSLVAPSEGKYKVYIIDEVHMLSKSAFNALLKTLEEPPAHVVFILATTDIEKVPITITSRSQVFTFHLVDPNIMFEYLKTISTTENINISDDALRIVIARGGGSFRDTLSLLDQVSTLSTNAEKISEETLAAILGLPLESKISDLLSAYIAADFTAITAQIKSLLDEGIKPESLAESTLKKILSSPSPGLLPLLEKLPSVSAPFPEAKLLLAFLSNSSQKPNNQKNAPMSFKTNTTDRATVAKSNNNTNKTSLEAYSTEKPLSKPNVGTEQAHTTFNLDNFLISLTSPLAQQLKKCRLSFSDSTLHIYPAQKITHTILTRKNNSDLLRDNLPKGVSFVVHDLDDLKKSPEVSKISDIMGQVQEVNDTNGGIPF